MRLPEHYTTDQSRHPTFKIADYPLRVVIVKFYVLQSDPRFTILEQRCIN